MIYAFSSGKKKKKKSLLYLSLKRFLKSDPAGNEGPFPPILQWITKLLSNILAKMLIQENK